MRRLVPTLLFILVQTLLAGTAHAKLGALFSTLKTGDKMVLPPGFTMNSHVTGATRNAYFRTRGTGAFGLDSEALCIIKQEEGDDFETVKTEEIWTLMDRERNSARFASIARPGKVLSLWCNDDVYLNRIKYRFNIHFFDDTEQ